MLATYFGEQHERLKDDYGYDPRIGGRASCTGIAYELADLLEESGVVPRILRIVGDKPPDAWERDREILVPKPYGGKVRWVLHHVCEADRIIYDPMLPEPLPIADYLDVAFDQVVDLRSVKPYRLADS